jgi:hypothetical protein
MTQDEVQATDRTKEFRLADALRIIVCQFESYCIICYHLESYKDIAKFKRPITQQRSDRSMRGGSSCVILHYIVSSGIILGHTNTLRCSSDRSHKRNPIGVNILHGVSSGIILSHTNTLRSSGDRSHNINQIGRCTADHRVSMCVILYHLVSSRVILYHVVSPWECKWQHYNTTATVNNSNNTQQQ